MTLYQGGKKRIGKRIHEAISIVDEYLYPSSRRRPYFEPFVGMAGVLKHFGDDGDRELLASDTNIDLIRMWKAVQKGWKPPLRVTREEYETLKASKQHSAERAFVGIVASWGGIWFHAYRLHLQKNGKDFMREGYNGLMQTRPSIVNVDFLAASSYDDFNPSGLLIYCDPPYKGNNLPSKLFATFDHEHFWDVMRRWSTNNTVIISESTAPKDFKEIWCTQSNSSNRFKNKNYRDCLFVHQSIYSQINRQTLAIIQHI